MIYIMKRWVLGFSLILLVSSYFTINLYGLTTDATIKLDRTSYSGYGAQPVVTLTDYDLNKKNNKKEEIYVIAYSTTDSIGITLKLIEKTPDSGVFTADFGLAATQSDEAAKILQVGYRDTITVIYKDLINTTGMAKSVTYSSTWAPSTGTIKLNKTVYVGLQSIAAVTVNDQDLNLRSAYRDIARIRITSGSNPHGFILLAYETGANTGLFSGSINFSIEDSDSEKGIIKINPTDSIIATYIDERTANNIANSVNTATASFRFSEAKIETSAANDEGIGNMLDITITDPDANNPGIKDRIIAKTGSYDRTDDLTLWLVETGYNTGKFKCRMYLNNENTISGSLQVAPTDKVNIKYIDNTVPQGGTKEVRKTIKWTYESTLLKMDKQAYTGYYSSAKISLINMELNKDRDKIEAVDVKVGSPSYNSIKLELKETGADSGEFTGKVYFGKSSKHSEGIVKVVGRDTIIVTYIDKQNDNDTIECYADWSPQDGQVTLDRQEYVGNSAPVKITVKDWDLADDADDKDEIKVKARIQGSLKYTSVTLTETYKNTGTFTGILYINGRGGTKPSIDLSTTDRLEVVYTDEDTTSGSIEDRAVYAAWGGISEAKLTLDKTAYKGYDTYMTISLNDPDQNLSTTVRDKVDVSVKTKSGKTKTEYTLTETSSNTGIFSVRLKFTRESPSVGKIRVIHDDEITVTFKDKKVSASARFSIE